MGQKYLESFEMWCSRRTEKIIWTDHVRNEVLHRVKEERKRFQWLSGLRRVSTSDRLLGLRV